MKKNFLFPSFSAALSAVTDDISRRRIDLKRRHIVIVPDRCTLTAERALCARLGGAFDAYVTTWSRLTGTGDAGYLPRKGSVMLVRKILADCHDKLKCYSRSWQAKGFASRMYDVIGQLSVCGLRPEDIVTDDGGKSEDIALVYSEYLKATAGELTDASGRMVMLARTLEDTDLVRNAVVYVACFDSYTALMERVLTAIESKAIELRMYDVRAGEHKFGDVELYTSPSAAISAKAIAARIAAEHRKGLRYDDICVVTAARRPDELVRIFRENGIPYCAPESLTLAEHRLGVFLTDVIGAKARGYRPDDILRLAKNPFSGVKKADSDALERFVRRRGITYKLFLYPFGEGEAGEEYRERAEAGRQKLASLLDIMELPGTPFERLERVIDYAESNYSPELAEADEGRASPFVKARELAALCGRLLSGVPDGIALDSFCEGMRETELSARPRLRGAVEIGGENDFRARTFRRVFVADFDSDTHPAVTADDGLISDAEIRGLRDRGALLSPTTEEVNARAADEFFLLLSGAERITLVYSEKAGDVLDIIKRGARSFTESGYEKEQAELWHASDPMALARYCPTKNMIAEQYLLALSRMGESYDEPVWFPYAEALSSGAADRILRDPASVGAAAGRLMLGKTTKVTQLESYFKCPRMHFFEHALKLKAPEEAELTALDIGSVLHRVAERYVSEKLGEEPEAAARLLLAEALAETGKSDAEVNRRMTRVLVGEAEGLCRGIRRQLDAGSFEPVATEAEFGFGGKYGGLLLKAGDREVLLRGKIDRIDTCGDLVRLIDYKTGSVSCKLGEVRMGIKLQLLLYLAVMRGEGYRPAGAFYLPTQNDFSADSPYMLTGFCDNGEDVLDAMDPDILGSGKSDVLAVKLRRDRKTRYVCNGESADELGKLIDYACAAAEKAAGEIAEGYIAPSPREGTCVFCAYKDCCGYGGGSRKDVTTDLRFDKGDK